MPRIMIILAMAAFLGGCSSNLYDPAKATRPYPYELHTTDTVDIQVFRDETELVLVNATTTSYQHIDVWINQRYVHHAEALPAGEQITLSLWDFIDERGEGMNAGGFFRTRRPTPVRLVEMQLGDESPMIGLITIRSDDGDQRRR